MKYRKILIIFILLIITSAYANRIDYVVIVNVENPVQAISQKEFKKMFYGEKSAWKNNATVRCCVLDSTSKTHKAFFNKYFEKSLWQYLNWWKQRMFLGKAGLIPKVKTAEEMLQYVAENLGAIGYIPLNTDISTFNVKIIQIINRKE